MKINLFKQYTLLITIITLVIFLFSNKYSYADDEPLQIDIMGGRVQAMPIAVSFFFMDESLVDLELNQQIPNLISKNLVDSGLFMLLDKSLYAKAVSIS